MTRARLLLGVAAVLAGAGALFVVLGTVFNPLLAAVAVPFGLAAYFLWSDATGRLKRRLRRRVVERGAAERERAGPGRTRRAGGAAGSSRASGTDGTGWPAEGGPGWWQARDEGARRGARGEGHRRGRRGGPRPSMDRREALAALDLTPDADQEAIRRAYRDRVKAVHPDAAGGDEDEFRRVRAAYERLRGPERGKG